MIYSQFSITIVEKSFHNKELKLYRVSRYNSCDIEEHISFVGHELESDSLVRCSRVLREIMKNFYDEILFNCQIKMKYIFN